MHTSVAMRLLSIAAVMIVAGTVYAQPSARRTDERAWHLGIEGATDFPLYVGVQVWVETPYRFRITVSTGEQPDAYLQAMNSINV
jgi:hypothetical protein